MRTEEVVTKKVLTKYIADDGTVFYDKSLCEDYEIEKNISEIIPKLPVVNIGSKTWYKISNRNEYITWMLYVEGLNENYYFESYRFNPEYTFKAGWYTYECWSDNGQITLLDLPTAIKTLEEAIQKANYALWSMNELLYDCE